MAVNMATQRKIDLAFWLARFMGMTPVVWQHDLLRNAAREEGKQ